MASASASAGSGRGRARARAPGRGCATRSGRRLPGILRVAAQAPRAGGLPRVHGDVGPVQQRGGGLGGAVRLRRRDADAGREHDRPAVQRERGGQHAAHRLGDVVGARAVDEDRELVATDPGERGGVRHDGQQPLGHADQQRVAQRVADRVVDGLEPVEIGDHDRDRPRVAGCGRERGRGGVEEARPVGQPGERVVVGQLMQLVVADPQGARQRPVAHQRHVLADEHERDEQRGDGRAQGVGPLPAREEQHRGERAGPEHPVGQHAAPVGARAGRPHRPGPPGVRGDGEEAEARAEPPVRRAAPLVAAHRHQVAHRHVRDRGGQHGAAQQRPHPGGRARARHRRHGQRQEHRVARQVGQRQDEGQDRAVGDVRRQQDLPADERGPRAGDQRVDQP
jgi:hypothetical protein